MANKRSKDSRTSVYLLGWAGNAHTSYILNLGHKLQDSSSDLFREKDMPDRTKTVRGYQWTDEHLSDFLDTTTIAGVFHIFRERSSLRRLLWGIVFIVCVIGCLVLLGLSTAMFIDKPTATTIIVSSTEESGLPFPAVTICNLNIKRNDTNITINDEAYQLLNFLFNPDDDFLLHAQGYNSTSILRECNRKLATFSKEERDQDIWTSLTSDVNLIQYCGFSAGANSEIISCKEDFQPILTTAGICYTYNGIQNGKPDKIITTTGLKYGMKMILNIDQETHPSLDGIVGAKVIVHERDDIARPNLYGVSVSPGQNADISVLKTIRIDETSEAKCIEDRHLELLPEFEYSQFACRTNALLEHIAQESTCDCLLRIQPDKPSTGPYVNMRNCTFDDICCLVDQFESFDQYSDCPLPCNFQNYHEQVTYSSFPNGVFLNNLAASMNMSRESIRDNFLSVHVFIEELEVTTSITQYTFGAVSWLADIGGQLGLFLGVSIITIFEVIILMSDMIFKKICPKKCTKTVERIQEAIPMVNIVATGEEEANHDTTENEELPVTGSLNGDNEDHSTATGSPTRDGNHSTTSDSRTTVHEEDQSSKIKPKKERVEDDVKETEV